MPKRHRIAFCFFAVRILFPLVPLLAASANGEAAGSSIAIDASSRELNDMLFVAHARWQQIGGGFAGCEGPQWIVENGEPALLFAAHHDHKVFKWTERTGLQIWNSESPEATAFRPDGRGGYFVVEQATRRVARWDADGRFVEVLAARFEGKGLNRPNDLIVRRFDGSLWFSDPDYLFKQRPGETKELPGQYIFRLDPRTRELRAVVTDLTLPNGLAFSPDETQLYFTDSSGDAVFRAPITADDGVGKRDVVVRIAAKGLDGLAFDPAGRLWCAAKDGVHVIDASGNDVGTLRLPFKPTAIAFHGGEEPRVCVTTREAAFVARLKR